MQKPVNFFAAQISWMISSLYNSLLKGISEQTLVDGWKLLNHVTKSSNLDVCGVSRNVSVYQYQILLCNCLSRIIALQVYNFNFTFLETHFSVYLGHGISQANLIFVIVARHVVKAWIFTHCFSQLFVFTQI